MSEDEKPLRRSLRFIEKAEASEEAFQTHERPSGQRRHRRAQTLPAAPSQKETLPEVNEQLPQETEVSEQPPQEVLSERQRLRFARYRQLAQPITLPPHTFPHPIPFQLRCRTRTLPAIPIAPRLYEPPFQPQNQFQFFPQAPLFSPYVYLPDIQGAPGSSTTVVPQSYAPVAIAYHGEAPAESNMQVSPYKEMSNPDSMISAPESPENVYF